MRSTTVDRGPGNRRSRAGDRNGGSDLLADPHCRCALEYLREKGGFVDVATLTAHVVARLTGASPEGVTPAVRRRVQTWLHHGHLPALAERGFVEFDPDAGRVRLRRDVDARLSASLS